MNNLIDLQSFIFNLDQLNAIDIAFIVVFYGAQLAALRG